ncbi:hypothetical protein [Bradyrhizobium sp.]|uniref:hypothetical protein n=1 Tax=Bradyrhizobium sp. TaxID=376 RepID=UPI0025C693F2|nr:hypothetical protein [Bradyrhizobium sp.]
MTLKMKPIPPNPDMEKALKAAKERWETLTKEEQEAELRLQRESWTRQDMD